MEKAPGKNDDAMATAGTARVAAFAHLRGRIPEPVSYCPRPPTEKAISEVVTASLGIGIYTTPIGRSVPFGIGLAVLLCLPISNIAIACVCRCQKLVPGFWL